MSVYVFLGPTLPVEEARTLLDAHYLPPAAMGDVYALVEKKARAIAVVDGFFEQTPAVWHKEILYALSRRVRVFGSSSMGALRASELHAYGMEGVGRIFEAYRDGMLEDDDEVAVAHGPAEMGYRLLSDAMVNVRYGLRLAEEAQVLSRSSSEILCLAAKSLFYPTRTWVAVCAEGRRRGVPGAEVDALLSFVRRRRPDQKGEDARELLRQIACEVGAGLRAHVPTFEFEPTVFWTHLTSVARRVAAGGSSADPLEGVTTERLRNHVRAVAADRKEVLRGALLLHLAQAEAKRLGLEVDPPAAVRRFRRSRGLASAEAVSRWMAQNRADKESCARLAELELVLDELISRHAPEVDEILSLELQRRGGFGAVAEEVDRKWHELAARGVDSPTLSDAAVSVEDLLAWYQSRCGPVFTDLETHAREWGFRSKRHLVTEMLAQYMVEKAAVTS